MSEEKNTNVSFSIFLVVWMVVITFVCFINILHLIFHDCKNSVREEINKSLYEIKKDNKKFQQLYQEVLLERQQKKILNKKLKIAAKKKTDKKSENKKQIKTAVKNNQIPNKVKNNIQPKNKIKKEEKTKLFISPPAPRKTEKRKIVKKPMKKNVQSADETICSYTCGRTTLNTTIIKKNGLPRCIMLKATKGLNGCLTYASNRRVSEIKVSACDKNIWKISLSYRNNLCTSAKSIMRKNRYGAYVHFGYKGSLEEPLYKLVQKHNNAKIFIRHKKLQYSCLNGAEKSNIWGYCIKKD